MKIGFIGVGGIAGNYLKSLDTLERGVAAVCDVNPTRTAEMAQKLGANPYTDHREMLGSEGLDAVFVCIPPFAHQNQVIDVAGARAHVFVAKPIALNLETARRTRDAIARSGVLNQAGYMARYSDITQEAQRLVGERKIGLATGRFCTRMGAGHPWWGVGAKSGGQMLEQSTHCFDWLRLFLGEVKSVHALGHSGNGDDIADFADSTVCNLQFQSGTVANIVSTSCAKVPGGFANELFGRDFYLQANHDFNLTTQIDGETGSFKGEEAGYFRQVEEFCKAVEAGDQSLIRSSYEDAARTLAVTIAANESLEKSAPVEVAAI